MNRYRFVVWDAFLPEKLKSRSKFLFLIPASQILRLNFYYKHL